MLFRSDGGGEGGGGGGGGGFTGAVVCRGAAAAGTEGVACNAADPATCAAGYTCGVLADGTPSASAVCRKLCNSDASCTAPGGTCQTHLALSSGTAMFAAPACTLSCNPLTAQGCGAGQNCEVAVKNDKSRIYTDCTHAGTGDHLAPCTTGGDCKAGFSCLKVNTQATRVCLQTCTRAPTASACAMGRTCQAVAPPNTLGATEYGWCY